MAASAIFSATLTFHRERAMRQEYVYRLPLQAQGFLNADPKPAGTGVRYIAFTLDGYHLVTEDKNAVSLDPTTDSPVDDLSFTTSPSNLQPEDIWVEQAMSPHSKIVDLQKPSQVIDDAREPMLSSDGQSVAFVRDDHGRGRLMLRKSFRTNAANESPLTLSSLNIYEASFLSEKEYSFSAVEHGRPPQVYLTDATHMNAILPLGESRYPALSPNREWMAYSHFEHGVWNLWLRDQKTGSTRRIADIPCNQIQPAWEDDSKTLLYSTDCGRNLWFTAVSRRKVVP
jgi:hypothetical protein